MDNNTTDIYSLDFMKDIIEPINSKKYKTKELALHYNVPLALLKRYIKEKGFKWVGSTYVQDEKAVNKVIRTVDMLKATDITTDKKKVTYNINSDLYKLIKLQAIIDDIDSTEVVERALRKYISPMAIEMLQQIEENK